MHWSCQKKTQFTIIASVFYNQFWISQNLAECYINWIKETRKLVTDALFENVQNLKNSSVFVIGNCCTCLLKFIYKYSEHFWKRRRRTKYWGIFDFMTNEIADHNAKTTHRFMINFCTANFHTEQSVRIFEIPNIIMKKH